ncbi:MAG: FYDLN acid domain-containing protein, partial [Proteobacteria bacterium]|nr:FYDLN acid domain-containing protein [Pseudomonadota bacterium]
MVKRKWGVKRTCQGCGARFYDLNRDKPQCPKCGAEHVADNPAKPRRRAAPPEPPPAVEPGPVLPPEDEHVIPLEGAVETAEDDEDEDDDLEKAKGDDDGLIEDASELR